MATAQRVFWETVAVLAFFAALLAAYLWSGYRADAARTRLSAEHGEQVRLTEESHRSSVERLAADHRLEIDRHLENEAKAVFTSFAAGAQTAIAARWTNYLASAVERLRTTPGVAFVHIASPAGRIIASSDDELRLGGVLDERGSWALAAEGLITRRGESPDILELAGPVIDRGQPMAILWIGYDLGLARRGQTATLDGTS